MDTVGRDEIGQWMGTALSSSSFGLIVSPLLGGIVYEKAGYMAVFAMALSLIIVDVLVRLSMIEKKTAAKYEPPGSTFENGLYGTFTHPDQDASNASPKPCGPRNDSADAPLLHHESQHLTEKRNRMPTIIVLLGIPRLLAAIYGIFVNVSISRGIRRGAAALCQEGIRLGLSRCGLVILVHCNSCSYWPSSREDVRQTRAKVDSSSRLLIGGSSVDSPPIGSQRHHEGQDLAVWFTRLLRCVIFYVFSFH